MEKQEYDKITRDEIRKEIKNEFQLERMILFSDAVFAIVMTLMAFEIRMPEIPANEPNPGILHGLRGLFPVLLAHTVSFVFIGVIWYQHLKIFGLLKNYDAGLVIRNLLLLFFILLFPFSASLITNFSSEMSAFFVYLVIIMLCVFAQYLLYHYIVVKRPELRIDVDVSSHVIEVQNRKLSLICFSAIAIIIVITYVIIPNPNLKGFSTFWMIGFPIIYQKLKKKP